VEIVTVEESAMMDVNEIKRLEASARLLEPDFAQRAQLLEQVTASSNR
jgi:hypothetical protein